MPERHISPAEIYEYFKKLDKDFKQHGQLGVPNSGIREEDEEAQEKCLKETQRLQEKKWTLL